MWIVTNNIFYMISIEIFITDIGLGFVISNEIFLI